MAEVSVGRFVRAKVLDWAAKALRINLQPISGRSGWWNIIREPYTGAWQQNQEVRADTVLTYGAVFACVTLIASDIAKLALQLVEKDEDGIWTETESAAFSPVLRTPNRFQTCGKYVEQYITSKLVHGNTYVLKQRDGRRVVTALYVLDPTRVTPMVAPDGALYYELKRDDLSNLPQESVLVPASEIIHDTMVCLYHPLVGVSPIYACGLAALQGIAIQGNSNALFRNGAVPGGTLTTPLHIPQDTADRLKAYFETNFSGENAGNIAILGDDMKYTPMSYNAVDMQLIDQLNWTGVNVCTAFHVPPYMIGIGPAPPYGTMEPQIKQYFAQCLQSPIKHFEDHHDKGLGLGPDFGNRLGTYLDIDDLIWLDTDTKMKAATDGVNGGLSYNEVRKRFHGVGPVPGGNSPLAQQQYYSLAALAERDAADPFAKPAAPAPALPSADEEDDGDEAVKLLSLVRRKQRAA